MRRRLIVLAVTVLTALLGATAGWVVGGSRSAGFVSTASVVINPLQGNAFWDESVSDIVTLQTEAQQARSDEVLAAVAESSDVTKDVGVLRRRVTVSVASGSEVIRLSYKGSSAVVTEAVAEALAQATLGERLRRATTTRNAQVAIVEDALRRVRLELAEADDPASKRVLTQRQVVLLDQLSDLEQESLVPGALIGVSTNVASRGAMRVGLAVAGGVTGALLGLWLARKVTRGRANERMSA